MDELMLYFYSQGDLCMLFAKVMTWMVFALFLAVIFGCIRGLRL